MFVLRPFFQAAAFCAAIFVSTGCAAEAAVPGGANVNLTGTVSTQVVTPPSTSTDGLFFIEASGTFFAQSLIEDPDALSVFILSTDFTAGGREFFDLQIETPPTSVNGLLDIIGTDFDEVIALGAPIVTTLLSGDQIGSVTLDDPIFGLFENLNIGFEITDVTASSNSIMGDFSVGAELTGTQLGAVQTTLEGIFGPINFEPAFAFEFNAEIAPIPLPAAFPLLLSGVVMLGFFGWRRKAAA